jgi:ABC-type multidrug transport system ATPase subunit
MSKIDTPLLQTSHTSTSSSISLPPEKLPELFQTMLKYPETRSHMLFLGPPGSGKTTTAQSFALALHGKKTNTFASLLFLNSSDERSLETMRQKIYPFVESRMQSLFFFDEEAPPKVIIFDEATSALDFESEQIFQMNMNAMSRGRTVIIISHRLASLNNCNRIITIANGLLMEQGKPAELLKDTNSFYYKLCKAQLPAESILR